ncbi:MAG: efflux RND transporter periplasmic adaptor subunit [Planctomycetes bacterium]|nr:efflux RND transporter periplasmic adaptor subunit [Planctomycetota bacterium]
MRKWRGLVAGVLVVVLGGAAVWMLVFKPVPVFEHVIGSGDVVEHIPGTGAIEYPRIVSPGFEVTGRITQVLVDQGDTITSGQELARIDDEVYRAEEGAAGEEVELVRASLDRLRADIKRADAQNVGALAHVRRQEEAFKSSTISRDTLDQAIERAGVADAELARTKAALVEGERRLAAATRAHEVAVARLQRTILRSPLDGVVLARLLEPGDVAVPGSAALRIGDNSDVWASVWVDETFLSQLMPGQKATVALRSSPEGVLDAEVLRVGREVDRETRELLVDLRIENAPSQLAVGQRADAMIHGRTSGDVVRVPSEYLVMMSDGAFVWAVNGGKVELRQTELGIRGREWVEIRTGLAAGDVIARPTPGVRKELRDGVRITVQEPTP